MRTFNLGLSLIALVGLLASCSPDVRDCADKTLFVSLTLGGQATDADQLVIDVSVDRGTPHTETLTHVPGKASGGIQVEFPSGYPQGKLIEVTITARLSGATIASGSASITLAGNCQKVSLTVSSEPLPDLAKASGDLTGQSPDLTGQSLDLTVVDGNGAEDLAPPSGDLTGVVTASDLAPAADLIGCAADENCFNGIDDDCDGLIDCEDPFCTAGATPKADCVTDPGSATLGLTALTTCPSSHPTRTALKSGFTAASCQLGTASCASTDPGMCISWRYSYPGSSDCSSGVAPLQINSTDGCIPLAAVPSGTYYLWTPPAWFNGPGCYSGSASKTAPSFSGSEAFCTGATLVGGGCGGGKVCVPHAPNHCVLKDGDQVACPGGFTKDTTKYYLDFSDTLQCNFGCNGGAQGSCSNGVQLDNTCTGDGQFGSASCTPWTDVTNSWSKVKVLPPTSSGTCGTAVLAPSGTSAPTGPKTVCCTP